MASSSTEFDYASAFGIESLPAAIVFVILYFPLLVYFLSRTIKRPIYVYFIMTLFCTIRVTAFILRAVLANDTAAAENLNVFIAYEILFNTGFFGLLYSAYNLVNARIAVARNPPNNPVSRLIGQPILFRLGLTVAVALGITGVVESTSGSTASSISIGETLRKVGIYIFLVGAVLVLLQTVFLARSEIADRDYRASTDRIGSTYGIYILFVITLLLLIREVFFAATASDTSKENNEAFWYPLAAVPELLAVALFAIPGLVPDAPKEP